jgi:hypothetical protein
LKSGENVLDYFPEASQYNKYYKASIRAQNGAQYQRILHKLTKSVGREQIERTGLSFADPAELQKLESAGFLPSGYTKMHQSILDRWSAEAASTAERIWGNIGKANLNEAEQRLSFVNQMTEYYTKGAGKATNFVGRMGSASRAADTLDAMAGALQDARFKGADAIQREFFEIGKTLGAPPTYSLDLQNGVGRYLGSVSNTFAWHGTGLGQKVTDIVETPGVWSKMPWGRSYVMDNIIPHVRGFKSTPQMLRSLNWAVQKEKIFNWLDKNPFVEKTLGSDRKKWLLDYFGNAQALSSPDALGGAMAHHFYLTTLGANLSSTATNMLQTWTVTMNAPGIGPAGMYRGLMGWGGEEGLLVKMERYAKQVLGGVKHEEAFRQAFPEFVKDAGDASQIVETMLASDIEKEGIAKFMPEGAFGKIKSVLMAPFSTSEAGNRLLSYYAGRNSHLFHNAARWAGASAGERAALLAEAGEVGQSLNWISNFPGGPLGVPKALMNMNPIWRQFAHFPIRFMGFLQGSARLGADPNKLDWGTMGRALAGSTTAYLAARDLLGVDISRGLLTGALPVPTYAQSPFYPFPFVPPIAQIGGTVAMDLLQGKTQGLGDAMSMLVPGGISLKRAYQTLSPRFADYENPTPEGRVPLYDRNRSLVGTLSPMELVLRSMGLRPTSLSAEAGAAKWILSQRDRLRQYRRDYTQALADNETRKAERIAAEFQKAYPELGPLQVKKTDIKAIQNRREIARLTRIERGIPTAYRPIFSQVIGEAGLGRMIEDLQGGTMPGLENYLPQQ